MGTTPTRVGSGQKKGECNTMFLFDIKAYFFKFNLCDTNHVLASMCFEQNEIVCHHHDFSGIVN